MREQEIERALVAAVRSRGGQAWKFTSPGTAGVPDRILLMPGGRLGFVELKAPGSKPRELQLMRFRQMERLGFRVYVIDGKEQIGGVLDEIQSA